MQKFLQFKSISKRIPFIFLFFHSRIRSRISLLPSSVFPSSSTHTFSHNYSNEKKAYPIREEDVGISPGYGFSPAHPHSPPSGETERRWHNSIRKFKAFPSFLGGGEGSVSMHKLKPIRLSLIYSWPSLVDRIYTRNIPFRSPFGWMCHRAWLWVVASGRRAFPSM